MTVNTPQDHPNQDVKPPARRQWVTPSLTALPPLTDLTLATGGGIPGECNIFDPSTCF